MRVNYLFCLTTSAAALAVAQTVPDGKVKRSVSELRESYDFVIIGGGTAGLTVADRLTEAFPNRTVLVVEIGDLKYAPANFEPPGAAPPIAGWSITTRPMPALNNRTTGLYIGKAVGGSTTINGQFFDRGGARDYDAWAELGKPEFDGYADKWDWEGLRPYFKKSVTFTEPSAADAAEYGYTWDVPSAYGGSTPIHAYYPPFQWPLAKISAQAWAEAGVPAQKECGGGIKTGQCWVPTSQHPVTAERSHAGVGHFLDVVDGRPNYDLLVLHRVARVVFPPGKDGRPDLSGTPKVEIRPEGAAGATTLIEAKREVIVSAGALNTPLILQRSGIGPRGVLERAGIKQILDLPGVGSNFHDHGGLNYGTRANRTITPNADTLGTNATLRAQAITEYAQRPARGPYTLALGNSAAYVSLPDLTADHAAIVAGIRAQVADGSYASYLAPGTDASVLAGYRAQLALSAGLLSDRAVPVWESPSAGLSGLAFFLRPVSRGSVSLDPTNPVLGDPVVDFGSCANPADLDILATFVPFFRKYFGTKTVQDAVGPLVETSPGPEVTTKQGLIGAVRASYDASYAHPCCTAAMLPRSRGGVVAPDLRVHGARRLSVIDLSVVPMLPGSHTSATVYAMAEKAADIIIRRWSSSSCSLTPP